MGEGGELGERVRAGEHEREGECRWERERGLNAVGPKTTNSGSTGQTGPS